VHREEKLGVCRYRIFLARQVVLAEERDDGVAQLDAFGLPLLLGKGGEGSAELGGDVPGHQDISL
jgi:hypothetical protein